MNAGVCLWKIRGCWEDIKKKDMCRPLFYFIYFTCCRFFSSFRAFGAMLIGWSVLLGDKWDLIGHLGIKLGPESLFE